MGFVRKAVGFSVIGVSHLAVIPVMAMYGVSVCPVLYEKGFGFGCRYTATLIAAVLLLDVCVNVTGWLWFEAFARNRSGFVRAGRYLPFAALLAHLGAFAVCTHVLTNYFKTIEVPGPTIERMAAALGYTAALLGVLQATILDWLACLWMRAALASVPGADAGGRDEARVRIVARWAYAKVWDTLPVFVCFGVAGVAVYRKVFDFVDEDIDLSLALMAWRDLAKVGALLGGWLLLVKAFAALKERDVVADVHRHLEALSRLDGEYRSPTVATGYWESVFSGLNRTTELIAQRSRLIKGLTTYVSSDVAVKVLAGRQLKPEGERRDLVLLFSDLRDFTAMSQKLPAEAVVNLLNTYFSDMIEVLTAHGATLDKFIGDGILAYFEPLPKGPSAEERAVGAAFAMHERLVSTNAKLAALGLPSVALGAGIHSGEVVLGSIGSADKMQFTVVGDAVNVAARLEPLCKKLGAGIIVSERVASRLGDALASRLLPPLCESVRGVHGGITVRPALLNGKGESAAA